MSISGKLWPKTQLQNYFLSLGTFLQIKSVNQVTGLYIISKSTDAQGWFRPRQIIQRAEGWYGLISLPRAQPLGIGALTNNMNVIQHADEGIKDKY